MNTNSKKQDFLNNLKSFSITYSPFVLTVIALVDKISIDINTRIVLIYLPVGLSSVICIFRKEIPRLYPYESIKGKQAQVIGIITLLFWSILGVGIFIATI